MHLAEIVDIFLKRPAGVSDDTLNTFKEWDFAPSYLHHEMGGTSMIRNICSGIYGLLIFIVAITPVVILFVEGVLL